MELWIQWVIGAVALFVIEMLTPGAFFFACFAVAALVAASAAHYGAPWGMTWIAFFVSSALLLLAARPFAKRLTAGPGRPSNVDELIGKTAIVESAIAPHQPGTVKVGSEVWRADAQESIKEKSEVVVVGVDGTRLLVKAKSAN